MREKVCTHGFARGFAHSWSSRLRPARGQGQVEWWSAVRVGSSRQWPGAQKARAGGGERLGTVGALPAVQEAWLWTHLWSPPLLMEPQSNLYELSRSARCSLKRPSWGIGEAGEPHQLPLFVKTLCRSQNPNSYHTLTLSSALFTC